MRLELLSADGDLMGVIDMQDTPWAIDGDCFVNEVRVEINVAYPGVPAAICFVRSDGSWGGYARLYNQRFADIHCVVVMGPGDIKYEMVCPAIDTLPEYVGLSLKAMEARCGYGEET